MYVCGHLYLSICTSTVDVRGEESPSLLECTCLFIRTAAQVRLRVWYRATRVRDSTSVGFTFLVWYRQADLPEKQSEFEEVKKEVQNLQKRIRQEEIQADISRREGEEEAREIEA